MVSSSRLLALGLALWLSLGRPAVARAEEPGLLAAATTSYAGSYSARRHNLELAARLLDGQVVPPGGVFSFKAAVGWGEPDRGYVLGYGVARAPTGAQTVHSPGGGLSQVVTTLYQAVFFSGLEIVERVGHLYWIDRYRHEPTGLLGLDATVDEPGPDFRFRNSTDQPVLIRATTHHDRVTVALYGQRPGWQVQVTEYQVEPGAPAPARVRRWRDPLAPAATAFLVARRADGMTVRLTRLVLWPGGERVFRSLSRYLPTESVLVIGDRLD